MRLAVLGHGSIGRRHTQILRGWDEEVVTIDPRAEAGADRRDWGMEKVDAALVCSPATAHVEGALEAFAHGARAVFIEKPLAAGLQEATRLVPWARAIQVGYNLRYIPSLREMREKSLAIHPIWARLLFAQDLRTWREGDYRNSVSAQKKLGGGILLEASHELDLVRWFFGPARQLCGLVGKHSRLEIDVEDIVALTMRTRDCPVVEVHLDMISPGYNRFVQVIGDETLLWSPTPAEISDSYVLEMRSFLEFARSRIEGAPGAPGVDFVSGLHALVLVEDIRKAAEAWGRAGLE